MGEVGERAGGIRRDQDGGEEHATEATRLPNWRWGCAARHDIKLSSPPPVHLDWRWPRAAAVVVRVSCGGPDPAAFARTRSDGLRMRRVGSQDPASLDCLQPLCRLILLARGV